MKKIVCLLFALLLLVALAVPAFAEFDAGSEPNMFRASAMIRLLLYNDISADTASPFANGNFPVSNYTLNHLYTSDMTIGDALPNFYTDGYYWFQADSTVEVYAGGVKLISDGYPHAVNFAAGDLLGIKFLSQTSYVPFLYYGFAYNGQDTGGTPSFSDQGYNDSTYLFGNLPLPQPPDDPDDPIEPNPPVENVYSMFQYADITVTMSGWENYPAETYTVDSRDYLINGITFSRFADLAYYNDSGYITADRATVIMDFSEHPFDYRSMPFYFYGTDLFDSIDIYYESQDGSMKTVVASDVMVTGYTGGQRRMFALPTEFSNRCIVHRIEFYFGRPADLLQTADFYVGGNDYNAGYAEGFSAASAVSQAIGYREGFDAGNSFGYNRGYVAGQEADNTFYELIFAVVDAPVGVLRQMFNFNILGVNMSLFIFSMFTVIAVIVIVKKVKKL